MGTIDPKEIDDVRLIEATIVDVKPIIEVHLYLPEWGLYMVRGKSGQGKSATVDGVAYAMVGGEIPREIIRRGAEKAKTLLRYETNKGIICADMVFTKKGGRHIKLYPEEQGPSCAFHSATELLHSWLGVATIDLGDFVAKSKTAAGRREQRDMARGLLPENLRKRLDVLEKEIKENEKLRTTAGTQVKVLDGYLQTARMKYRENHGIEAEKDAPENVDTQQLRQEEVKAKNHNTALDLDGAAQKITEIKTDNASLERDRIRLGNELTELKSKVIAKENEIKDHEQKIKQGRQDLARAEKAHETKKSKVIDTSLIIERMRKASQKQSRYFEWKGVLEKEQALRQATTEHQTLDTSIKAGRQEVQQIYANSPLQIKGLAFDEEGLTYKGWPYTEEHLSTGLMYVIGAAILLQVHKQRRMRGEVKSHPMLRCREASALDEACLEKIQGLLHKAKGLMLAAKSGTAEGPVSVILSEGRIVEERKEQEDGSK